MERFVEFFVTEWRTIWKARTLFVTAILIIAVAIWWIFEMRYSDRIASKNATIAKHEATINYQQSIMEQLKSQTNAQTPEMALREIARLRAETAATVTFSKPTVIEQKNGGYLVRSYMKINSTTPRSGLTVGFTSKQFDDFDVLGSTESQIIYGPYTNPNALVELGAARYHFRNVNGAYKIQIKMTSAGSLVIRHRLEGKMEGPVVTWKIPSLN